jgi:hypothetical protein
VTIVISDFSPWWVCVIEDQEKSRRLSSHPSQRTRSMGTFRG